MARRRKGERRKTLNKRQRLALAYPCRTAAEMMHTRFVKLFGDIRTILTTDIDVEPLEMFEDRTVWHASTPTKGLAYSITKRKTAELAGFPPRSAWQPVDS